MVPEVNVYIALLACGVAFLGINMTLTTGDQFRNIVLKYGKPTFTQILPSVTMNGVVRSWWTNDVDCTYERIYFHDIEGW